MTDVQPGKPTHPPFDPETVPALEQVRASYPKITTENIPKVRAVVAEGFPGLEPFDLTVGGAVRKQHVTVPATEKTPALDLLVLSPASGTGPWPAI
jgi:hypothetical protein